MKYIVYYVAIFCFIFANLAIETKGSKKVDSKKLADKKPADSTAAAASKKKAASTPVSTTPAVKKKSSKSSARPITANPVKTTFKTPRKKPVKNPQNAALGKKKAPTNANSKADNKKIDENLYSRQLFVLGKDAMTRMANSDILISGLGGLGVEIAKNVILAGVKSVTLHDDKTISWDDLSTHFYASESDIGKNRALISRSKLAELNSYVSCQAVSMPLSEDFIKKFAVVVLTEKTRDQQLKISDMTHRNNVALIIADTAGVFAQIFNDFGEKFIVNDINGAEPVVLNILNITNDKQGVVTVLETGAFKVRKDDFIVFTEVQGMIELNDGKPRKIIKLLDPKKFVIGDTSKYSKYTKGGQVMQIKSPKTLKFQSFAKALESPTYIENVFNQSIQHLAFNTLHEWRAKNALENPKSWNEKDAQEFVGLAKAVNDRKTANKQEKKLDERLLKLFAKVSRGQTAPITAAIGGIVGQEVMKACSGKFHPIYQFLYYNAVESLPVNGITEKEATVEKSRYKSTVAIYGKKIQRLIQKQKYFLVGAGAIGCELLKNFAMMGVATERGSKIYVTDMDLIEKSNLNRQFLFRNKDIRQPKSLTAVNAIRRMNANVQVQHFTTRVGRESEDIFTDEFYENLDGLANALDNVEARLYMDGRAVYFKKPLLESGTMGTLGHTQIVVPDLTSSYGSTPDAPEEQIPLCTLKNFPTAIAHTIQWARDTFEGYFHQAGQYAQSYMTDTEFLKNLKTYSPAEVVDTLEILQTTLVDEKPNSFKECIVWARNEFEKHFSNQIKQLLLAFPPDEAFWAPPKRCPKPIVFNANNKLHSEFVFTAANLRAQLYGIPQNRNRNDVTNIVKLVKVAQFVPDKNLKIPANDEELQQMLQDNDAEKKIKDITKRLPSRTTVARTLRIKPIEFEKDDDKNLHIDYINAASNLRAINYGIKPIERLETKKIAGKIIPAIATTTSVAAGFISLEMYKLVQKITENKIYKNTFFNLAVPILTITNTAMPKTRLVGNKVYNLWSRYDVQGDMTLREFLKYFKDNEDLELSMISIGEQIIYARFLQEEDINQRQDLPITKIYTDILEQELDPNKKSITITISISGEDETELPFVKYKLPTK